MVNRRGGRNPAVPSPDSVRSSSPVLVAEASETLRRRAYRSLRCHCGAEPVTRYSGKGALAKMVGVPPPRTATPQVSSTTLPHHSPDRLEFSGGRDRRAPQMREYLHFVVHLDSLLRDLANGNIRQKEIQRALNGGATTALRRLVPHDARRSAGAFFTPTKIANATTQLLQGRLTSESVVYDPACGAGDLLLAAARALPCERMPRDTWSHRIIGRDLCPEFTAAARRRLLLEALRDPSLNPLPQFPRVRTGCGFSGVVGFREATHVVVNPPFGLHPAPPGVPWASGRVSEAATFFWRLLNRLRPGTEVVAILPDVLRSGTNYTAWRRAIAQRADLRSVHFFGQFDHATNVHASLFDFVARKFDAAAPLSGWIDPQVAAGSRVGDHFDVHVGSVVHYRDAHCGARYPYVHSGNLPPWSTMRSVHDTRLTVRAPVDPPLVVVRRMSRPGDPQRAVAAIVALDEPVILDNHLLTLTPRHGGLRACQRLLAELRRPVTTEALNRRIRCRHLTVGALADLEFRH